ncbi:MAG: hypothetical protein HKN41_05540 [Ilumatobacter sp.]|nr:hypothetical protein [Ilumatobacter sp.]
MVPLPAAPALTAPATTRPIRRPTFPGEAGHLPEPESETVMVAAGLADLPIELVGLSERGLLVTLDPATGRVARRKLDRQTFGSPGLAAGEGWLLISGGSGDGRPLLVRDDGTARSVDPGISWPILIAPGTDRVWRVPLGPIVGPSRPELVEVSLLDGPTGVALPVLGDVLAVDPLTGGLAVDAPGGTYIQTVDGVQRLTSGRLIGLGRDRALVNECDEQLACGYVVVDRMTAERRPLAVDRALGDRTTVQSLQWWALPEPMSPVGNRLLVATWDQFGNERPSQGILDLETGAYTVVTENIVPMAWGPNGDIVFFLESGRLFAFDVVTGETVAVAPDLDRLAAFTWRHDLPSVEG